MNADEAGTIEVTDWPEHLRSLRNGYWWDLVSHSATGPDALAACAVDLAAFVAKNRLPPSKLALWTRIHNREHTPTDSDRSSLRVYFQMDFGLPGHQPADHRLEGAVAEALWRRSLYSRIEAYRSLVHLEGHSIDVTDHGGDGLAIYRDQGGLNFRLWEIKKHVAVNGLRSTVTGAHKQLDESALSYLARFSLAYRDQSDPELARLLAELVDMWIERSAGAGAGVAVASELRSQDDDAFEGLPLRFPELAERLEGLAHIFVDYPAFCGLVQAEVWKGL